MGDSQRLFLPFFARVLRSSEAQKGHIFIGQSGSRGPCMGLSHARWGERPAGPWDVGSACLMSRVERGDREAAVAADEGRSGGPLPRPDSWAPEHHKFLGTPPVHQTKCCPGLPCAGSVGPATASGKETSRPSPFTSPGKPGHVFLLAGPRPQEPAGHQFLTCCQAAQASRTRVNPQRLNLSAF